MLSTKNNPHSINPTLVTRLIFILLSSRQIIFKPIFITKKKL